MEITNGLKKSLLGLGVAAIMLTTGCASTSTVAADNVSPSPSASSSSAEATAVATASATGSPVEVHSGPNDDDLFGDRLYSDSVNYLKPGESFRVTGGTYQPGDTIKIQGYQLMPMPSYNAAEDMYYQVGEQVPLTEPITVTADEKGKFDTTLLVPAGLAPQQMDVISEVSDGTANLVRVNIG